MSTEKLPEDREHHEGVSAVDEDRMRSICQALIENSFDVLGIIGKDGNIAYISPSLRHVLGYTPEERVGKSGLELIHPDDLPSAKEKLAEVQKEDGAQVYQQLRLKHKDGEWRDVEAFAHNLLSNPYIQGIVVNYRDVTDRKWAINALRVSEERYHKAFDGSPDSITLAHLVSGRILEVNHGFEEITGYSKNEVIGQSAIDLGLWSDPNLRKTMVEKLKRGETVRNLEMDIVTKTGEIGCCLVSAQIMEFAGEQSVLTVARDVTVQKLAAMELQRASDQIRSEHHELQEKNIALKQVLDHIDDDRARYRHELSAKLDSLLAPIIAKLKRTGGQLSETDVAVLENDLKRVIEEDIDQTESTLARLTPREMDICELIKKGMSSKEIADELGLSAQTVHKHRQVIRRKLQLNNRDINLATFLRSL